jgi:HSF-type DNA-binding
MGADEEQGEDKLGAEGGDKAEEDKKGVDDGNEQKAVDSAMDDNGAQGEEEGEGQDEDMPDADAKEAEKDAPESTEKAEKAEDPKEKDKDPESNDKKAVSKREKDQDTAETGPASKKQKVEVSDGAKEDNMSESAAHEDEEKVAAASGMAALLLGNANETSVQPNAETPTKASSSEKEPDKAMPSKKSSSGGGPGGNPGSAGKGPTSFELWKKRKMASAGATSGGRSTPTKSLESAKSASAKGGASPVALAVPTASTAITVSTASASHDELRSEDNDAAEALKAIMQLGQQRPPVDQASAAEPQAKLKSSQSAPAPAKVLSKKSLPTKRARDNSIEGPASGSAIIAAPMGLSGMALASVQVGPGGPTTPTALTATKPTKASKKLRQESAKKKKLVSKDGKKVKGEVKVKVKKVKGESKKKVKASAAANGGEKTIRKPQALPEILMDLLNKNAAPDSIFWLPGTQIFGINKDNFKKKVIPKYFNGKTFTSITKSLNLWYVLKATSFPIVSGVERN